MKCAKQKGSPKCAASAALSSLEPSSQTSGALVADRLRGDAGRGMLVGQRIVQPRHQVAHLDRIVGRVVPVGLAGGQHAHGALVAARRAADAEVDAAGEQRLQHAEVLGHLERAVVRQHHAAGADLHALGQARDAGDQHLGRRAGERLAAVMLGQPVAMIAEPVAELRQLERLAHRVGRRAALADRRLVENAETQPLVQEEGLKPLLAHGEELVLALAAQRVGVEVAELGQRVGRPPCRPNRSSRRARDGRRPSARG